MPLFNSSLPLSLTTWISTSHDRSGSSTVNLSEFLPVRHPSPRPPPFLVTFSEFRGRKFLWSDRPRLPCC